MKETTPEWKYPQARVARYGEWGLELALEFYVDNIMLDHYERQGNVEDDLRKDVLASFRQAGVEIPVPQQDIRFRGATVVSGGTVGPQ